MFHICVYVCVCACVCARAKANKVPGSHLALCNRNKLSMPFCANMAAKLKSQANKRTCVCMCIGMRVPVCLCVIANNACLLLSAVMPYNSLHLFMCVCVWVRVYLLLFVCLPAYLFASIFFIFFLLPFMCVCVYLRLSMCVKLRASNAHAVLQLLLYIYIYVCVAVWLFIFSCKPLSAFVDLFDLQKLKGSETEVENKEISLKI